MEEIQQQQHGTEATFIEHIAVLRNYIIIILLCIAAASFAGYFLFDKYIVYLTGAYKEQLFINSPAEAFMIRLNYSIYFGVFINIPLIVFYVTSYIMPALTVHEKRILVVSSALAVLLFIAGLVYAYIMVIPTAIKFLFNPSFVSGKVGVMLNYTISLKFILTLLLAFALIFEFPILLYVLLYLKLMSVKFLVKNFRFVLVVIVAIAAVATPSPDWVSQIMLSVPMIVLFWLTILAAKLTGAGKNDEEPAEEVS
ncbi:MAG: twin-arginine translocase subunit TatC [Spirochaetia bacterium]|nr:twin-arginine translocase subunit TatC [Spirochaetia bacterium]